MLNEPQCADCRHRLFHAKVGIEICAVLYLNFGKVSANPDYKNPIPMPCSRKATNCDFHEEKTLADMVNSACMLQK